MSTIRELGYIEVDNNGCAAFFGDAAQAYSYKPELRAFIEHLTEVAHCSSNRHFAIEGMEVKAAQSNRSGITPYLSGNRIRVSIQVGCGNMVHVIGTNGGKMPCGGRLTMLDGSAETYYCENCR